MRTRTVTEVIGWYGFAAVLAAYGLSNLGFIAFGGMTYQLLNLSGAAALFVDAWPDRNWQIVVLNVVWASIAVIAILK